MLLCCMHLPQVGQQLRSSAPAALPWVPVPASPPAVVPLSLVPAPASTPAVVPPVAAQKATYWTELNKDPPELHGMIHGELQKAVLSPGPDGFAVAVFSSGQVVSEVPNLLLAAKPVLKRPASVMACDPDQQYNLMYYKRCHVIGVREKFGKKRQVMSFGGSKSSLTRDELWSIGKAAILRIQDGASIADAKGWAQAASLEK